MFIDMCMNFLRANKSRKGSTFGWPEPYESVFENMNETLKKNIERGKDADLESDARRRRSAS